MMRKLKLYFIGILLLAASVSAQESAIVNLSRFQDGWGNTGGFWQVTYGRPDYLVLKIKNHEKEGAADIVFTREQLKQFEDNLLALKQARNTLKDDGFQVTSSITSGDAVQHMLLVRLNGVKLKTVQVVQQKAGEAKQDHHLGLSTESYYDIKKAVKTARRKLKWQ